MLARVAEFPLLICMLFSSRRRRRRLRHHRIATERN